MNKGGETKGDLSEIQIAILTRISDGAAHNLLGYPFIEDHHDLLPSIRLAWAAAMLAAQKLIEMHDDVDAVWIRITDAGRAALAKLSEGGA